MSTITAADIASLVRAKRRRDKFWNAVVDILGIQLGLALAAFSNGWMFMLAVGVAHAEWVTGLPTIGYWWAVLIMWLLPFGASTAKRDKATKP